MKGRVHPSYQEQKLQKHGKTVNRLYDKILLQDCFFNGS